MIAATWDEFGKLRCPACGKPFNVKEADLAQLQALEKDPNLSCWCGIEIHLVLGSPAGSAPGAQ